MPAAATAAGLPSRLGKYELLLPLAAGGMARIYIGRSTGIGHFERHVVLKMITPERANDLTAVNMFLDEARLAASLNHQNVAQVFEVGEEGGIHYLAMEYVHGQDLRAVLAKAGSEGTRIPLELSLTVVAGAAAGLHHAHERRGPDGTPLGIVHRDVSPSNLMIGYDGAVKLLDFGIAKATQRSVETQSGIIKGKFAYMAPEQCRGRDVDRRSDVFSLGIILYEVSTQHRCFRADSDFDTMHRIVTGDVVRPTRLVQGYPQALEAIVMKALATDPAQRYQSAGLLLEALESFAVSSRMSLSTMGLGRFMRDMFGEVQEPWLGANRGMQSLTPKENTISSTGGASSEVQAREHQKTTPIEKLVDGVIEEEGRFENSSGIDAAKTMLEMPKDAEEVDDAGPDWSAKSYPPPQSAAAEAYVNQSGSHRVPPPELAPTRPTPPPQVAQTAQGTQPLLVEPAGRAGPSSSQFATPGSGSAPAHPAIVSTKHGYASAAMTRGDVSYPRYTAPHDALAVDVQLRPNRRPLFIGIGIVVAGVIVMLVVALGGGKDPETASGTLPDEPQDKGENVSAAETPDTPDRGVVADDDSMVSIVIHSDPAGADVMIAGAKIGATPLETKLRRGTKIHPLTVRKEGYVDFAGKIDLGGEYENKNIKLVRVEDAKADPGATPPGDGSDKAEPSGGATDATGEPTDEAADGATGGTTGGKTGGTTGGTGGTGGKTGGKSGGPTGGSTGGKQGGGKSGGAGGNTGGGTQKPPPPKCQPPGPNVDPFGAPICKT